uniref:Fibronectin type-III domain-containing protein n=1 Tax=Seriola dumerili TaxID=41447 RepID=A0A3B4UKF5_SERDU
HLSSLVLESQIKEKKTKEMPKLFCNLKRKLITQLQPDTDYSFVLMSRGNSAGGLQQQVSIRTAPDLLPRVPAGAPIRSVSTVCLRGNHTKKRMICNFSNGSEVSSLLSLSLILE